MKYIRTKDGIYEDAGTEAHGLRCVRCNGEKIALSQDYDKIVKEADTIKELFDAYVSVDDDGPHCMSKTVYKAFKRKISKRNIYGAIWVFDSNNIPTLKPAAKLNGEGEWELICTLKWLETQRLRQNMGTNEG